MIDNINKNKNQRNYAIEYDPKFDNKVSLSSGTEEPLPVVAASIRWGKKQRMTTIAGLICLWDSIATNSMIKRKYPKHYELKMQSNKM